jgi:hypothetical protein
MASRESQRAEIQANYEAFEAELPSLLKWHEGKFAVYRHRRLLEAFDDYSVAEAFGRSRFDDGLFSIQEVTQEPLDIWWFKYASDDGAIRSDRRAAHRS